MNSQPANRDRLIVALDVPGKPQALELVSQLSGSVSFFKIGLQLFTAVGPEIVHAVRRTGASVFLDLKLHDIPNTVANAVRAAGDLDVQMLTLHLSGGREMIEAAVSAKSSKLQLLGVTVLTSADSKTLLETGVNSSVEEQVSRLASLGAAAGLNGFVASPRELGLLRQQTSKGATLVIPGVRPAWSAAGDQKRITTPRDAIKAGADYLVIGRPIIAHADPVEAVRRIIEEISGS